MKDFDLIKYVGKQISCFKKCARDTWLVAFPYRNDAIYAFITFENKIATRVEFGLSDIYEKYAKRAYGSVEDFLNSFTAQNTFFKLRDEYLTVDLEENALEHVASQALAFVSILIDCLNKFLNLNVKNYTEKDWRNFHRQSLYSKQKLSKGLFLGSIAAFCIGIAVLILSSYAGEKLDTFLLLLGFLLLIGGIVSTVVNKIREIYFKRQVNKSKNSKY